WLAGLREELVSKTYRPSPVRRVMIRQRNGGGERPLGRRTARTTRMTTHKRHRPHLAEGLSATSLQCVTTRPSPEHRPAPSRGQCHRPPNAWRVRRRARVVPEGYSQRRTRAL